MAMMMAIQRVEQSVHVMAQLIVTQSEYQMAMMMVMKAVMASKTAVMLMVTYMVMMMSQRVEQSLRVMALMMACRTVV